MAVFTNNTLGFTLARFERAEWGRVRLLVLLLTLFGCKGLQQVEPLAVSTLAAPVWNSVRLQQTVDRLRQHGTESGVEPTDGLVAFMNLNLTGLQPIVQSDSIPAQLSVRVTAGAELEFIAGYDVWPHAESDTGTVMVDVFRPAGAESANQIPFMGIVADAPVRCARLDERTSVLVIVLGILDVRPFRRRSPHCISIQMSYSAWERLTAMDRQVTSKWLAARAPYALPVALRVKASLERKPTARRYGTLRLLPGKDPVLADELVIIGTDLDRGHESGWVMPAVLIELARQAAQWSQQGLFPRRSVLFALWPDRNALNQYLKRPYWPADATHVILHVGNSEEIRERIPLRRLRLPQTSELEPYEHALEALREALWAAAGGA